MDEKQVKISVIIPCRNEEKYIGGVIENVLQQEGIGNHFEIIIVDGLSEDNTAKIVENLKKEHNNIKLLKNPKRIVPAAMNMGIQRAEGEIIVRLDAHASYPKDYIKKLLTWKEKLNADNVGGVWLTAPSSDTDKAKSIAIALSHPLGVGNSYFRTGVDKPMEVDTVPFGCYEKNTLEEVGLYDERLARNQDIELNKRLKEKGGKIFLVPDIRCTYYARDTFPKLWKNNYENGKWVILTSYYTKSFKSLSLRHFIPLFFILYLLTLPLFMLLSLVFIVPLLIYIFLIFLASGKTAVKYKKSIFLFYMAVSFTILHLSYGAGSIAGIISILGKKSLINVL